ncbi:MAG: alpha-amylase family glycosyl hydrolase [Alistipes sp.]
MKRLTLLLVLCTLCACQTRLFTALPDTGNATPVYPLSLAAGINRVYLTDYFPQWVTADSITTQGLRLTLAPMKADWSEFFVTAPTGAFVETLDVWRDGRKLSIVAQGGSCAENTFMYSEGSMLKVVSIRTSQTPKQIVAMWQNCRLPETCLVKVDSAVGIIIPKDAKDVERSFLRVFAATEDARFNDVLIPLNYGRIIKSSAHLNRHDRQAQVLYSLMIDRFSNGNPANDRKLNQPDVLDKVDYQGGDLKGITNKIRDGFFDDLGITTLWISPITQNPYDAWGQNEDPATKFSGYHGYWPIYTTQIDKRFGTDAELKELLATAHEHGMNVILDYVANHLHINSPVLQTHPDWTTPMHLPDGRLNLQLWDEQRLTTWFDVHIPSLDLERADVCEPMTDSALYWIANYDFDGFRHDACKHIPENYWRMLCHKLKSRFPDRQLWQIGETYGSPELIGSYVKSGMIDAQFDFNVYHTAIDVLVKEEPIHRIAEVVAQSAAAYGAHHTMGNITGNHDKARFISLAGGALALDEDHKMAGWKREVGVGDPVGYKKLALLDALILTIPGVPCIYQGDEYGIPGANDPDNRRMMRFEEYSDAQIAQKTLTKALISLRRSTMSLLYGDLKTLVLTDHLWLFVREYMGECTLVALNNGGTEQTTTFSLPARFVENKKLKANFGHSFGSNPDGSLTLTLAPYSFEIITKTK